MAVLRRPVYVAATGSDTEGNGTSRRPFASIDRARAFIRSRGFLVDMTANQIVHFAAGTYYQNITTFGPEDSGTNGFEVVYQCDGDPGDATLVGGRRVTDWRPYSGSIYRTPLATPVYTMFENGVRATVARIPVLNPGVDYPCAFAPYFTAAGIDGNATFLQYDPGDFDPSGYVREDLRTWVWSAVLSEQAAWFTDVHGVPSIDTTAKTISMDHQGLKFFSMSGTAGARYFLLGDLSFLTGPGQFTCSGGWLYYWARDGAIANQTIVIPTAQRVVSAVGTDEDTRVTGVRLEGLAIECSDFNFWYRWGDDGGGADPYGYFYTPPTFQQGGVYLENVDNVTVNNCHIKNTGFSGIFLQGYAQNCTVSNSWIEHTGSDGISANGRSPGQGNVLKSNTYTDLKINNFGELDGGGNGLRLSQSSDNVYSYLDISQGPRRAVWVQGAFDVPAADNYAYNNAGSYIRVSGVMQDSGEAGAITMSFLSALSAPAPNTPNTLDQVIIDGVNAHPSMIDTLPLGLTPAGLFGDNKSFGQGPISNVQISNVQGADQLYNDSGDWTFVNCSWLPGFNPALMSPDIGLTADFPF